MADAKIDMALDDIIKKIVMDQEIVVVEVVEEIQFNVEVEITNEEIVVAVLAIITITAAVVAVISDVAEVVIHLVNEIIIVQPIFVNNEAEEIQFQVLIDEM